jgi:ferrous iron transport protein B
MKPWPWPCKRTNVAFELTVPTGGEVHAITATPAGGPSRLNGAIVLVGNPNVGKSALFGALTSTYVTVSNYPGTTVELSRARSSLGSTPAAFVDTPGVLSLVPASEDERVARDLLLTEQTHAILVVGDAKNLARTLSLALQVSELGRPFVLCLNMMDEATAAGARFDLDGLERRLGVAVCPTVAVRGEGLERLRRALRAPRVGGERLVQYPEAVELALAELAPLLRDAPVAPRALGLMALAGDREVAALVVATASDAPQAGGILARAAQAPELAYSVAWARHEAAAALAQAVESRRGSEARGPWPQRLDRLTTHPGWGYALLGLALYATYLFVGVFGAGTLVGWLEDELFGRWINPAAIALVSKLLPWAWARDLLVGPYGFVTMALTYSLALVLPIVGTFFIAFSALEDSGYLPRLAVMANRTFRAMGLNGKAVLPMVLGLGCDTMATLTTRILETPRERLLVILLLALGVPCSAQLSVTLALLQPLPAAAFWLWAGVVVGVIFGVGRLAARLIPGRAGDFVLELPPLRWPRPGNMLRKTLARVEWYLREAVPLFALGTLLLFAADRLALLGAVERATEPLLTGGLGLPKETAEAFVVGFLRRDFGAAGLYRLSATGALRPQQVLVAVVTMTLFIPCIANFFMIVRERGWRTALAVAAFVFPFAFAVGAALNAVLNFVPLPLR